MARGPKPAPAVVRDKKIPVRSKREVVKTSPDTVAPVVSAGPTPPKWLADEGLAIWMRLAPTLAQAKLLSAADTETFGRYCRNFARWLKMQAVLDQDGEVYLSESKHGDLKRANPAFLISDRIERQLLAAEDRFGLNPAERQRIFAARAQSGVSGDLLSALAATTGDKANADRPGDPAATPTPAAKPIASPIGMLN